jgi:hyperpolarization activated cyclic nucleotide-gated potassium channel 4
MLESGCSFGEIAIICNIPQPYSVRVCELCRLLRLDKQSFTNILEIYFIDGRKVLSNLTEVHKITDTVIIIFFTSPYCTIEFK